MKSTHGTLTLKSPIGPLTLIARAEGLTHVFFPGHEGPFPAGDDSPAAAAVLARAAEQLGEYFAGRRQRFDLPLAPTGTDFQRSVWLGLREIPYGATLSYGELARRVGRPQAVRAVGAANGANPLPLDAAAGSPLRFYRAGSIMPRALDIRTDMDRRLRASSH